MKDLRREAASTRSAAASPWQRVREGDGYCVPNELAKPLWKKFKDRQWNEEFEIKQLTILQRETFGYDKKWKSFREIRFRGNPEWYAITDKEKDKKSAKVVDANQISLF